MRQDRLPVGDPASGGMMEIPMKMVGFGLKLPLFCLLLLVLAGESVEAQTGSVRGRVREQKGGPLSEVVVIASSDGHRYETKSDARGEFQFQELAPGDYAFSFSRAGYKSFNTRRLAVAAGETVRLRQVIELAREEDPYAVIRGAVLYGVGFTLPNAAITLERIDGKKKMKMETVSHEGGEFAFRLRADKANYRLTARAPGFEPASIDLPIENDEVRNVVITLQKK